MVMDFLMEQLNGFMDWVTATLKSWLDTLGLKQFEDQWHWLVSLVGKLNFFLPIKEVLFVLSILFTFAFTAFVIWGVQKIYHMIRG